jgi:hypothetical protein
MKSIQGKWKLLALKERNEHMRFGSGLCFDDLLYRENLLFVLTGTNYIEFSILWAP